MNRRKHPLPPVLLLALLLSLFTRHSGSAQSQTDPASPGGTPQPAVQTSTPAPPPRRVGPSRNLAKSGIQNSIQQSPALSGISRSTPIENPADWTLTFDDEFNGSSLDTTLWATEYGYDTSCVVANPPAGTPYCNRSNNNEKEWYIDEAQQEGGGTLKLVATRNDCSGDNLPDRSYSPYTCANFPYLSGMISTHGKFSQKYGYFEARMKVPKGQGFWPAFWTIPQLPPPSSPAQVYWPPEIDIMEFKGQQVNDIYMTNIYSGVYPDPGSAFNNWSLGGYDPVMYENNAIDFSAGFHNYAIDWEWDSIIWYIDGVERARQTQHLPPGRIDPPDYTGQMQVIFDLAVSGNFVGNLTPNDSDLPASLEIDYVRVYQKTGRLGSDRMYIPVLSLDAP